MKKLTLEVKGMYCSHCSKAVENALKEAGIDSKVDLTHNKVSFSYDDEKYSLPYLARLVKRAGYTLVIDDKKKFDYNKILVPVSIIILIFTILGMVHHMGADIPFFFYFGNDLAFLIYATIAIIVLGIPFMIRAFKALRYKNIGMDFLIFFSSYISYFLSLYIFIINTRNGYLPYQMNHGQSGYMMTYFDTTCMILSIITLGHLLIDKIKIKADKNYQKAVIEPPKYANVVYGNEIEKIDVDHVDKGDILKVLAGETIPVDGKIIEGEGLIDESSMTGESRQRLVKADDNILGGTMLVSGPIKMKAEKIALDSLYSSIINESYVLDQKKGRLSRISDKIASIFTPTIIVISIIGFFIAYLALKKNIEDSIITAVSVLAVSCPCAFGLAVPISSYSGYDCALNHGVLFKTGDTFEKVKKVKAVIFDKTGTLTKGELKVIDMIGKDEYFSLVKAIEENSLHPLSLAIQKAIKTSSEIDSKEVSEIPSLGLKYKNYIVGSYKTIENKEIKEEYKAFIEHNKDASLVFFSNDVEVLAIFALDDVLADDAKETIASLKAENIKCYMLTGDKKEYALKMAREVGIDEDKVYYEADPKNKAEILREIKEKDHFTCYIGDGINDTLALKESSLSFASYKASEVACSSADALLLKPELYNIVYALNISKKTYLNIIENFIWAIAYNITMIPLAIMGIIPTYLCATLMIVSNLTLTLNSLRIKFYKPSKRRKKR